MILIHVYNFLKKTFFIDLSYYNRDEISNDHFRAGFIVAMAYFCIIFSSLLGVLFCKNTLDVVSTALLVLSQLAAIITIKKKAPIIIAGRLLNVSFLIFMIMIIFSNLETSITVHRTYWCFVYPPAVFFICGKRDGIIGSFILFIAIALIMSDIFITLPLLPNDKIRFVSALLLIILATYGAEISRYSALMRFKSIRKKYLDNVDKLQKERDARIEMEKKIVESAKLATLGEMAGGIAHEINSPLMVISGNANLLKKKLLSGDSSQDVIRYADKIVATVDRVDLIVKGLRSFIRSNKK